MKLLITLIVLVLPLSLNAEALFDKGIEPGYFVGPTAQFSLVDGKGAAFLGVEGAITANSEWMLGFSGTTMVSDLEIKTGLTDDSFKSLHLSYLGVKLGYISNPSWLIHWTLGGVIGGGQTIFKTPSDRKITGFDYPTVTESCFVVEPEFRAEVNVTDYLRFIAGVNYRWIAFGGNNFGIDSIDLSGVGMKFSLHFGKMSSNIKNKNSGMKW